MDPPILRFGRGSASPPQWELRTSKGNQGTTFVLDYDAYWVINLPKSVLDGHSGHGAEDGIFNGRITELMTQLVKFAVPKVGQPSKSAPARKGFINLENGSTNKLKPHRLSQ